MQYHNIMKRWTPLLFVLGLSAILLVSCSGRKKEASVVETYSMSGQKSRNDLPINLDKDIEDEVRLAAGDSLSIKVWGQPDLNEQVTLDLKGNMYYPLIGKVKARGRTLEELRGTLTEKLAVYYIEPQVSVMPVNLAGQSYYILGEVKNPGKFVIKARITVFEAAAAAGGTNDDAGDVAVLFRKRKNKLLLISLPLQFDDFAEANTVSAAMQIQADDILFFPPSRLADAEKFMKRLNGILSPLLTTERGIMYWPALKQAVQGKSGQILVQ